MTGYNINVSLIIFLLNFNTMSYAPETSLIVCLRSTLSEKPPYCSGMRALPHDQLDLYYRLENAQYVS